MSETTALVTLSSTYGHEAAERVAKAYEVALLKISGGQLGRMPDRETRLELMSALLEDGRTNGFVVERMTEAGLAALAPRKQAELRSGDFDVGPSPATHSGLRG